MTTTRDVGEWGEGFACRRLQEMGYRILCRDYHYANCQIDIIAQNAMELVFVEVKLRGGMILGDPEETVRPAQRKRIVKGALAYITAEGLWDLQPRFDVIAITVVQKEGRKQAVWEHFPGAFDATGMGF